MTIRNSLAPLICAGALVAAPMLSFADTAAPAPAPAAAPATASPVAAPIDTTTAPAEPATTTAPAAPATDTTSTDRPTSYTMVKGDTLDSIAHKFDTSIKAIAALNKITKSQYKKLRPGKALQIPPATASTPAPSAPTSA